MIMLYTLNIILLFVSYTSLKLKKKKKELSLRTQVNLDPFSKLLISIQPNPLFSPLKTPKFNCR